jgi:hypothetical protein|tara:strand:+ start:347 stop:604 length:258 start_codon:yes stop_codon:yes gene_type:complete
MALLRQPFQFTMCRVLQRNLPMVTNQQIADRKRNVASAIASRHLEGIAPDREPMADLERFAQGGLEISGVLTRLHHRTKRVEVQS